MSRHTRILTQMYERLYACFGPQGWWPADTPFEVVVGAILTQNTSWTNVEKAIFNLKSAGQLNFKALLTMPPEILAEYIRPAGFFRLKAARLQNLLHFIAEAYDEGLEKFFRQPLEPLREELLQVKGIGRETADAILLYAAQLPSFVVDAYTCRILVRHGLTAPECDYQTLRELFMDSLPEDVRMYGEFHALIVQTGKEFCKKSRPLCAACPLQGLTDRG